MRSATPESSGTTSLSRTGERRLGYLLNEFVTFTRVNGREALTSATTMCVGPLMHIELHGEIALEPCFDLSSKSVRFRAEEDPQDLSFLNWQQLAWSSLVHLVFFALLLLSSAYLGRDLWRLKNETEVIPVEMVFGLSEDLQASNNPQTKGETEADAEALKSPDQLPQLPKVLTVEGAEKPPDTMPIPATPAATPEAKPTLAMVVEATPDPGARVLKAEELLRRLERERRKVADKSKVGAHETPEAGVKDRTLELPPNPLSAQKTGEGAMPAGAINGTLTGPAQAYQLAAQRHVRRQWNLPDLFKFDAALITQVEVVINLFGKVLDVRIVKESGNKEFDEQVKEAVERSNPFPDFSNEGLTKRTLILSFRPREVR